MLKTLLQHLHSALTTVAPVLIARVHNEFHNALGHCVLGLQREIGNKRESWNSYV